LSCLNKLLTYLSPMVNRIILILLLTGFAGNTLAFSGSSTSYPDSLNKKRLYLVAGTGFGVYAAGLSYLSFVWYKDHERVPFHYYNDSKGYLQMDKAGHAYSAYWESYAAYHALRWAGLSKKKALIFGGPVGLVF